MKKFKVVITDYEYENVDEETRILEENNCDVFAYHYTDEENIVRVARDADAIIVQNAKITKSIIDKLDNCKAIARYAVGYDGIDLEEAAKKGIYVCNVRDYCYEEVATHTLSLVLQQSRRLIEYNNWTHDKKWHGMPGKQHSLKNQVVGLIGFGKIAKTFAEYIKPLCNNIWVCNDYVSSERIKPYGYEPKSFEEIVKNADYISIHCPLTDETRNMFNREVFKKMKNTAVVINVGRGPIVNEQDLNWAIENKEIGGACLDVLEKEPPQEDNPLFKHSNVIITPHAAWYSVEAQKKLQIVPAEQIIMALKGQVPSNAVNLKYFEE